jgi:hypothetical protein
MIRINVDSVLLNHEFILIMLCVFVCGNMVRRFLTVSLIFDNQNNCCALCADCSYLCNLLSLESFRVLCKFFAHGACLKGEHCEFSHDWKAPPNNVGDTISSMLDISPIYGY